MVDTPGAAGQNEAHVDALLSGYLDGELTQQQSQQVDVHIGVCTECAKNLEELARLRERMGAVQLSDVDEKVWRENMNDSTVRVSRGIGWLLFIGGVLLVAGVGVYEFVIDSSLGLFMKLVIGAIYAGLASLFISVLRQRLLERKSDKYKDVEI
jgi:hypothetical protein